MKKWLKENIFVKDMFIFILFAIIIFYIPSWVSVIIAYISKNDYFYAVSATWVLLWAGPFTPTIPIVFAIAVFLKQIFKRRQRKKENI